MKIIKCDICGSEIGTDLMETEGNDFHVLERNGRTYAIADLCKDCRDKIHDFVLSMSTEAYANGKKY